LLLLRKAHVGDGSQVVVCQSNPKKKMKKPMAEQKNDETETRAMWTMWTHPDWAQGG
jgi:hypothetical protein